ESPSLLKELAYIHRFRLIQNYENQGITKNINKVIPQLSGKYICICGSDDYWLLDKLEIQVAYMENNPEVAVCSGNALKINAKGDLLSNKQQGFSAFRTYEFKDVFLRNFPFVSTNAMIRKSVLEQVGLYDESLRIEDYYMWLKISHAGYPIHMLSQVLGYYRIHQYNTIHKSALIYEEMKKILATYIDHPLYGKAQQKLDKVYFPQLARQHKRKALQLFPRAISNTRFFYRGLFWLFVPNFLSKLS
ncbi:MAG: glycosyltransferase, partial [Saprospiraceae bacterium]|nr:glycosyltransferase [Saprospiraceae bacterium]